MTCLLIFTSPLVLLAGMIALWLNRQELWPSMSLWIVVFPIILLFIYLIIKMIVRLWHPLDPQLFISEEGVSRYLIRCAMWNLLIIFIFAALFLPLLVYGIHQKEMNNSTTSTTSESSESSESRSSGGKELAEGGELKWFLIFTPVHFLGVSVVSLIVVLVIQGVRIASRSNDSGAGASVILLGEFCLFVCLFCNDCFWLSLTMKIYL